MNKLEYYSIADITDKHNIITIVLLNNLQLFPILGNHGFNFVVSFNYIFLLLTAGNRCLRPCNPFFKRSLFIHCQLTQSTVKGLYESNTLS